MAKFRGAPYAFPRLFKQLDMHDKGGLFFGEYLFCKYFRPSCSSLASCCQLAERGLSVLFSAIWNLGTLSYKEMIVFVYNLYDEGT